MAGILPSVGVASYNGHTFSSSVITRDFRAAMLYDSAGRTVTAVKYTITVEDVLQADGGTDTAVATARKRLSRPGGTLTFSQKGAGAIVINPPGGGGVRDVAWGPKPMSFSWRPAAANRGCRITWTVEFTIPECDHARYVGELMEVNFRVSDARDRAGYITRTTSGHLRIPQSKRSVNSTDLQDNADRYLERAIPPLMAGFRRESVQKELSEDKCQLSYTVTDVQLPPNVPPPKVVEVSASHTVRSRSRAVAPQATQWEGTISATYELARGTSRAEAWPTFQRLVEDRVKHTRALAVRGSYIFRSLSMSEPEIYGKKAASFSMSYIFTCPLRVLLAASGMFRAPADSDWKRWSDSMQEFNVSTPRGLAKLVFDNRADKIVDLCQPRARTADIVRRSIPREGRLENQGQDVSPFTSDIPDPDTSWLHCDCQVKVSQVDETVELKSLPSAPLEDAQGNASLETRELRAGGFGDPRRVVRGGERTERDPVLEFLQGLIEGHSPLSSAPLPTLAMYAHLAQRADIVPEVRNLPSVYVTLVGSAIRAAYGITPPVLTRIGRAVAVPANRETGNGFIQSVIANWGGVPIVAAAWSHRYLVRDILAATGIPQAGNPQLRA